MNLAINGFGRIGRLSFRVALLHHQDQFDHIVINTSGSMPITGWAHLAQYDTTYRKFSHQINVEEVKTPDQATDADPLIGYFLVNPPTDPTSPPHPTSRRIPVLAQRDPAKLPWKQYQIDVVIESTGVFRDAAGAQKHLDAGAQHVVISAPTKSEFIHTYVRSVNQEQDEPIMSNASCTTNCISPVAKVIHNQFGVKKAFMNTIHAYTDDQNLQDNSHRDLRRARAAAQNIIPTSTGAAVATTETIPELKGLFDGIALRVPVVTGSVASLIFVTEKPVTVDQINQALEQASRCNSQGAYQFNSIPAGRYFIPTTYFDGTNVWHGGQHNVTLQPGNNSLNLLFAR
jgi:glyceraldehyde 3-phosphate dehydrogenase